MEKWEIIKKVVGYEDIVFKGSFFANNTPQKAYTNPDLNTDIFP